jgi:hypothetical protein
MLEDIWTTDLIDASIFKAAAAMAGAAIALHSLFTLFNITYYTWRNFMASGKFEFNLSQLARAWVIYVFLGVYVPVVGGGTLAIFSIAKSIHSTETMQNQANATMGNITKKWVDEDDKYRKTEEEETAIASNVRQTSNPESKPVNASAPLDKKENEPGFFDFYFGMLDVVLSAGTTMLLTIVRLLIGAVMVNFVKVLYVFGPLAFVVSLIPAFKDQFVVWMGTYINCVCSFVTMSVLDRLIFSQFMTKVENLATGATEAGDFLPHVAANLSYIIIYLCIFFLTSKWIGSGDSSKVLGTAVQAVTAAASLGGAAAGGAVAGQTKSITNTVAQTGADTIKNNND